MLTTMLLRRASVVDSCVAATVLETHPGCEHGPTLLEAGIGVMLWTVASSKRCRTGLRCSSRSLRWWRRVSILCCGRLCLRDGVGDGRDPLVDAWPRDDVVDC